MIGGVAYVGGWSWWRFDCAARTADRLDFASLRADGTELSASGLQVTTAGERGSLELLLAEPPPADATLVLGLLTKRSVAVVPFELKEVALP